MTIIKTEDLTGAQLDWAVAQIDPQCAGLDYKLVGDIMCGFDAEHQVICMYFLPKNHSAMTRIRARQTISRAGGQHAEPYMPSYSWSHGGPIIEREMLGIMPVSDAQWRAGDVDGANGYGPTPLIAAMRCFVVAKLGDSVDVPEELV